MSTPRYFQDELDTLRSFGAEFARYHPRLSRYLSESSTDPDVERLLEGFALLTGRLREKIDDQLPEVVQSLLMLLWPNFLRPVPSMTIIELSPVPGAINERQHISRGDGLQFNSVPVGDQATVCSFQLSSALDILPLQAETPRHDVSREKSLITLPMRTLADEPVARIKTKSIRFWAGGSDYSALTLKLWLHRYLRRIDVVNPSTGERVSVPPTALKAIGFDDEDSVLPYPKNSFAGYRLLQEFYSFPQKFYFSELTEVPVAHLGDATNFNLVFEFERPLPPDVRIDERSFKLHCAPAINLFPHDSEPLMLDGSRTEYAVQPAKREEGETDIFSIDGVEGWVRHPDGTGHSRSYARFESFDHEIERVENRTALYFKERVRQHVSGDRLERLISFVREDEMSLVGEGETISVSLTCTNGSAPLELAVGDVCVPNGEVPSYVSARNITRPTMPRFPVIDGSLQWQLISALSLNYVSLENIEALRMILGLYDFNALVDRQHEREAHLRLEGLLEIKSEPADRLFKGLPVRGTRSTMRMQESKFSGEGEMFLFASVLAEFFRLYATINSFHELVVIGEETGEEYRWTARIGNQPLT